MLMFEPAGGHPDTVELTALGRDELVAAERLAAGVLAGSQRALARALSLIEDDSPGGMEVLAHCRVARRAGQTSIVVGITGPAGAGKSSLIEALLGRLRAEGRRVAVLAADPSSPISGGALLGDRIRMGRHHADPGVFLRSMATRGHPGGLPARTQQCAALLGVVGFDVVLIETIGVGQDEVMVADLADVTVLVLPPGQGDEVQALKAGLMEIADIFIINKSDLDGAECLAADIRSVQSMGVRPDAPIIQTIANTGTGVAEAWAAVERCAAKPAEAFVEAAC
jgi:LAO/AO transport system kinase